MSQPQDGGPAFPQPVRVYDLVGMKPEELLAAIEVQAAVTSKGMTLLDYFAGQSLIARTIENAMYGVQGDGNLNQQELAIECWRQADAMLAERQRRME